MSRCAHVRTYGGVSIVNAIPALKGGAMAINLPVDIEVKEVSKA